MMKKITKESMGKSDLGWLKSRFHFSFAEYRNPQNMNFGVLRVLNDDIILPNSGFGMHPHANMEIISYIVDGEITHKDSMGNTESLQRGEVQYMSAGTGVLHSEYNVSSKDLRLLQIWIYPDTKNLTPVYGSYRFHRTDSLNKLLRIVSSNTSDAKVRIHQDVNIYVSQLTKEKNISFSIEKNRQIYFVLIEGTCEINGISLNFGDALEIVHEDALEIRSNEDSHFLFIEMQNMT